jgi:DNA-binding protein HU-beta
MNKADLIAALAERTGSTKADAGQMIDALGEIIAEALARQDEVTIPGVGKLATSHRAARTVRNPRTGEKSEAPAHYAPVFKPTAGLKETVKSAKPG